ncbi:hypothetical protein BA70_16895 [Bacillus zhangzhouensis]|uniref:Uncharacterized protein n=1 Tax=Bacillus zhangzhouensis TaxID=1178540 RepID=A0A081LCC0_9BACI|nr:hypothetical protein BA70_16895 [Bacillus zhangzhouensis]
MVIKFFWKKFCFFLQTLVFLKKVKEYNTHEKFNSGIFVISKFYILKNVEEICCIKLIKKDIGVMEISSITIFIV